MADSITEENYTNPPKENYIPKLCYTPKNLYIQSYVNKYISGKAITCLHTF